MESQVPTIDELRGFTTKPASELSPEAQNTQRFHGSKSPYFALNTEKPWHRYAAYLFATGATETKYVARACNVSEPTVRNLLRQPWFQERVNNLMAENGGKDIMALIKAEQFNCLVTMVQIRDDPKAPPVVRTNICRDILDRTLGRPIQRIETEDKTPSSTDPVAEVQRLEKEVALSRST